MNHLFFAMENVGVAAYGEKRQKMCTPQPFLDCYNLVEATLWSGEMVS